MAAIKGQRIHRSPYTTLHLQATTVPTLSVTAYSPHTYEAFIYSTATTRVTLMKLNESYIPFRCSIAF